MKDVEIKDFKVTFLGTSAASISPRSHTTASLVEIGQTKIMVDAGIGSLSQLRKIEFDPDKLDAVLLTHWHIDHFAGLPGLVRSRKISSPLHIYGPRPSPPTRIIFQVLFPGILKDFVSMKGNNTIDFPDIHVEAFNTVHGIISVGWMLTENPLRRRRVIICGDTRPAESIVDVAQGADLMIHEATYLKEHSGRAISHWHSTVPEAAQLANKSNAGSLVLNHIASRYSTKAILTEAEKIFPGTIISHPLMTISIEPTDYNSKNQSPGWARISVIEKVIK